MENYLCILKSIKAGNKSLALSLIEQFYPLLKKYSSLLNYEDSYNDLEIHFIKTVCKINSDCMDSQSDSSILKYIETSIYHEYIRLSKKHSKILNNEFIVCNDNVDMDTLGSCEDDFSRLLFNDIKKHLSKREYNVIFMTYYENCTTNEIAKALSETTYNIYKIKDKALKKLKKILI
ncbi:MAG: sigma-70 family RNA polymerase sigma factor [Oscillospiraceae bacterium]